MRATQHFHYGLLLTTQRKEISKQEREKLFTREISQQAKEEREIFLGFLLILQLNKLEGKARTNFFWIFSRLIKHTRRKWKEEMNYHG